MRQVDVIVSFTRMSGLNSQGFVSGQGGGGGRPIVIAGSSIATAAGQAAVPRPKKVLSPADMDAAIAKGSRGSDHRREAAGPSMIGHAGDRDDTIRDFGGLEPDSLRLK